MSDIKLILDSPEFWKSVAFLLVVILTIFPFYSFAIKTARDIKGKTSTRRIGKVKKRS